MINNFPKSSGHESQGFLSISKKNGNACWAKNYNSKKTIQAITTSFIKKRSYKRTAASPSDSSTCNTFVECKRDVFVFQRWSTSTTSTTTCVTYLLFNACWSSMNSKSPKEQDGQDCHAAERCLEPVDATNLNREWNRSHIFSHKVFPKEFCEPHYFDLFLCSHLTEISPAIILIATPAGSIIDWFCTPIWITPAYSTGRLELAHLIPGGSSLEINVNKLRDPDILNYNTQIH